MENNKDGILLETGTNEIEIMEFTIDGNLYGINVAKVREIMLSAPVHPMPHAHPAVEGIFKPRDIVITVVDLPEYLSGHTEPKGEKDLFIITNFNKMHIAFRVHTVVGISRISWRDIQKPDNTVSLNCFFQTSSRLSSTREKRMIISPTDIVCKSEAG